MRHIEDVLRAKKYLIHDLILILEIIIEKSESLLDAENIWTVSNNFLFLKKNINNCI